MAVATITPVLVANAPTSMADLTTGPTSGNEWSVSVRVTNTTSSTISYFLYLTTSADNTESAGSYRIYDYQVNPKDARDMEVALLIPNGYKLRHKASASGLAVTVIGKTRSTA